LGASLGSWCPSGGGGCGHPGDTSRWPQRLRDTGQLLVAELVALEREQQEVDARAGTLETELRSLMASGRGHPQGHPQGLGDIPVDMGTPHDVP
ncbi:EH1L1 protein, partial [Eurystomus gularis]|nr:EH1L1 protein [Eurystomus gularis]